MSIDSLTTQEAIKLRDALKVEASMVLTVGKREIDVSPMKDGSDRICIRFGEVSLYLSNFSAEALGRDLIAAGVRLQYTLEAQGRVGEA